MKTPDVGARIDWRAVFQRWLRTRPFIDRVEYADTLAFAGTHAHAVPDMTGMFGIGIVLREDC